MRGATALVLFAACAVAARYSVVLTVILGVSGLFTAFEALRGWCVLRACGIKTKF